MLGIIGSIVMVLCGVIAASSAIMGWKPKTRKYIEKLLPFQAGLGVSMCIWGIITVIRVVAVGFFATRAAPIWWLTRLAAGVLELTLGFLLGFELIGRYLLSRNAKAMAKGERIRSKLLKYQIAMGFLAIGFGVLGLLTCFR